MLFRRRKKKKQQEQINDEVYQAKEEGLLSKEDLKDKKKVQHFILERCEQIIETTKEIAEEKSEYQTVTDYLNDIQQLEELSESKMKELRDEASTVLKLNGAREEYLKTEKKISDVQFALMQQEQDNIPGSIKRLQSNEAYQAMVKKDMNYLEGEKSEWYFAKLDLMHQQKILRILAFILLAVFILSTVVLIVLQSGYHVDTTYAWMSVIFIAAVGGFCIFIKMQSNQSDIKKAEINRNHAVSLLNKIKFKYVNVTNAVDYTCEKYHVKNSYELNYQWEQYLNTLKEREKYERTNEDLEYSNEKLLEILERFRLHDAKIWVNQVSALVKAKEMTEIKHDLIVRRQKLRGRMEFNTRTIREQREQIDRVLECQHGTSPEVKEILKSIDGLAEFY